MPFILTENHISFFYSLISIQTEKKNRDHARYFRLRIFNTEIAYQNTRGARGGKREK